MSAPALRSPELVVGIDPGTRILGYGVVGRRRTDFVRVDHGVFMPEGAADPAEKLKFLYDSVGALLRHHRPDMVALEDAFFHKNPQSTLRIGEARAVVLLAAAGAGIRCVQYATRLVKRSTTGSGAADKRAVQEMVAKDLNLTEIPEPSDAADALALALCALRDPRFDARFASAPG